MRLIQLASLIVHLILALKQRYIRSNSVGE